MARHQSGGFEPCPRHGMERREVMEQTVVKGLEDMVRFGVRRFGVMIMLLALTVAVLLAGASRGAARGVAINCPPPSVVAGTVDGDSTGGGGPGC